MLTHQSTNADLARWKEEYATYKDRLRPNRISGAALPSYLESRYPLLPVDGAQANRVVCANILENECFRRELPPDTQPSPVCRIIAHEGAGEALYRDQDDVFAGCDILVGIDLTSGYFLVEGSSLLWDELFARRGLNETDLKNFYSVAEYVACLRRFGWLERALTEH
ncbi:MAG: hypothetical protein GX417_11115 [Clostridiales bacterium]|nr:hypothetical protein [Clostridiales bacterium]